MNTVVKIQCTNHLFRTYLFFALIYFNTFVLSWICNNVYDGIMLLLGITVITFFCSLPRAQNPHNRMHREPETVAQWAAQSPSKPSSVPVCFPVKDSNIQRSEFHDSGKPSHCVWTCSVQVSTLYMAALHSITRLRFTMRLSVISVCPIISAAF